MSTTRDALVIGVLAVAGLVAGAVGVTMMMAVMPAWFALSIITTLCLAARIAARARA